MKVELIITVLLVGLSAAALTLSIAAFVGVLQGRWNPKPSGHGSITVHPDGSVTVIEEPRPPPGGWVTGAARGEGAHSGEVRLKTGSAGDDLMTLTIHEGPQHPRCRTLLEEHTSADGTQGVQFRGDCDDE